MSFFETRLFHATLRSLHQLAPLPEEAMAVHLKSIGVIHSTGYAALAAALVSLSKRRWFGEPLFTMLQHIKREGVVEFIFNPALRDHLLPKKWFACLNLAELESHGVRHAGAHRLLWVLRSYARPKDPTGKKKLSNEELRSLLYGSADYPIKFGGLKQAVDASICVLTKAGISLGAATEIRGKNAKGIRFTLPPLPVYSKKVLVVVPRAVAPEPVPEIVSPLPAPIRKIVKPDITDGIGSLMQAALSVTDSKVDPKRLVHNVDHTSEPDYRMQDRIAPPKSSNTDIEHLRYIYEKLCSYGLKDGQAHDLCNYVLERPHLLVLFGSTINRCITDIQAPAPGKAVFIRPAYIIDEVWKVLRRATSTNQFRPKAPGIGHNNAPGFTTVAIR